MKPIASVAIIREGNGTDVLVNNVVEKEINRQRLRYERKVKELAEAIERRDLVDAERHKLLGIRLAEFERKLKPAPSFIRTVKQCCLLVVVGIVAIGQFIIGR